MWERPVPVSKSRSLRMSLCTSDRLDVFISNCDGLANKNVWPCREMKLNVIYCGRNGLLRF